MDETLLDHALKRTSAMYFLDSEMDCQLHSSADILSRAMCISRIYASHGVRVGDVICLILPNSVALVACIIAAWGCRTTVCLMPQVKQGEAAHRGRQKQEAILHLTRPSLIVHDQHSIPSPAMNGAKYIASETFENFSETPTSFPAHPCGHDVAVIQLTSGSTNLPKGVMLRHEQIMANVAAIRNRAAIRSTDRMISWLPMHHDMGFSAFTEALFCDIPTTIIPTERSPTRP